jgi:3',5'-cyclic-AMP phosphodiesterase
VGHPLISVFAIEDDAIQVTWRALPAVAVSFAIGDRTATVQAGPEAFLRRRGRPPRPLVSDRTACGGPGATVIDGLTPATTYDLTMTWPGRGPELVETITTLPAPPGRLLSKFATISDLHIGERGFGATHTIQDVFPLPDGWESYTLRCARAAIGEAEAWGAEAMIVKGDVTGDGEPVEFREAGRLLAGVGIPIEVTLGNHEFHDRESDPFSLLAEAGIHVPREPWALDLSGVRIILGHTWRRQERAGRMGAEQRDQIVDLAGAAPAAAFVALHHQPQRWRIANQYPPGIPGPQAGALLDALVAANPATMISSGHTHRHRLHRHGPLLAVEVGSTKDYPGTWAGYAVHEGGIRQVVRRIAAPEAIGWTEGTYWALRGVWGWWAPGAMSDRCFTHVWPSVARRPVAPALGVAAGAG